MKEMIILTVGIIIGAIVASFIFRKRCPTIGNLRQDCSDPTIPPYLFLELSPGGYSKIMQKKRISLKVVLQDYICAENTSAGME